MFQMLVAEEGVTPEDYKMMKKYHCCCNLKTASIIIGFIFVVSCTVIAVTAVLGLTVSDGDGRDAFNPQGKKTVAKIDYIFALLVALIILINSGCLVYGALTEKKKFIAPWLIAMGVLITLLLCATIYFSVSTHSSGCLFAVLIAGVLIYFWFCVLGFYHTMDKSFEIC